MTIELKNNSGYYPGEIATIALSGVGDTDVIYTVPAGKTFYCTGFYLSYEGGVAAVGQYAITNGAGTTNYICGASTNVVFMTQHISGGIIFSAPTATQLKLANPTAGVSCSITMWGFLQ